MTRTCDECVRDGGWHYSEDGSKSWRCPNYTATELRQHAKELEKSTNQAAMEAARRIVSDAAERLSEFSANQLRQEIEAAQIVSSGVMGRAFTWAKDAGLIEWTGRMVPSSDPGTHAHRLFLWRSLVRGERRAS